MFTIVFLVIGAILIHIIGMLEIGLIFVFLGSIPYIHKNIIKIPKRQQQPSKGAIIFIFGLIGLCVAPYFDFFRIVTGGNLIMLWQRILFGWIVLVSGYVLCEISKRNRLITDPSASLCPYCKCLNLSVPVSSVFLSSIICCYCEKSYNRKPNSWEKRY
jgi:hypothetical protein